MFCLFRIPYIIFQGAYERVTSWRPSFALLAEVERIRFWADLEGMMGFGAYKDGPPIITSY